MIECLGLNEAQIIDKNDSCVTLNGRAVAQCYIQDILMLPVWG